MAVQKFPPPPFLIAEQFQPLNLWLIKIQSILNAGGTIDPEQVEGLVAAYAQITQSAADIVTLQISDANQEIEIAALQSAVTTLQGQVGVLQTSVATLQGQVIGLLARNQIRNGNGAPAPALGNDGDLYIDNTAAAPNNLYAKVTGNWLLT